ncbi:MAG: aspartate kinase [Bacteroidetes bacterium]|nr:MAG: aspartate kinase [Bacteroidota bacterium]
MKVYKFGGASVRNADAVRNVAAIINNHDNGPLIVVISAMGKTTNMLEKLTGTYFSGELEVAKSILEEIKTFHLNIAAELFTRKDHTIFDIIERTFYHLYYYIRETRGKNYNYEYDRIVSTGEFISTQIVSEYLTQINIFNRWFNARDLIITDSNYRDAGVDWLKTEKAVKSKVLAWFSKHNQKPQPVAITQGFVGGTTQGFITTLGREGSDYSAAIFAYTLGAEEVVIWKDVSGLLNADPKKLNNTILLKNISYQEAIELAYYGATVIHPKTLKPLLKKNIPLKVKSFYNPGLEGSIINKEFLNDNSHASYIFKSNQILLSIFPKDFSFIAEQNLSRIFSEFARAGIKINLMQNSALSFSVCFDEDKIKTLPLLKNLKKIYHVKYNTHVELITIRHYEKANLEEILEGKEILLEQKSRITLQWVVKSKQSEEVSAEGL